MSRRRVRFEIKGRKPQTLRVPAYAMGEGETNIGIAARSIARMNDLQVDRWVLVQIGPGKSANQATYEVIFLKRLWWLPNDPVEKTTITIRLLA